MASNKKIGLREVRGLQVGETLWDASVPGFGIRRQNSPAVAYVLLYRTKEGRLRRYTIGRHGAPWTPDTAREEATRILGDVAKGKDPAADKKDTRQAKTVAELCDLYLTDAENGRLLTRRKAAKKESTLQTDRGRITRHIKPLLGRLKVAAVTSRDVEDFMNAVAEGKTAGKTKTEKSRGLANVRGGKGTASRTVGLLGAIFTYSIRHRMRSDNPVHGVMRFADGKRERRLSDAEYKNFGKALAKAEADKVWPAAVAVARFLALTGWRSGEALNLRWKELDLARRTATLPDTKTGRSVRPLSLAACDVLSNVTRRNDDDLVFQATRGDGPMVGFPKLWAKIAAKGKLPDDITPHVLRHSFASLAGDLGYSELTIAALVGHKGQSITSRYVHTADAILLAAADMVANKTAELMGMTANTAEIIPMRRAKEK
ncbi:MAG: tyrosine-type recombinase/integrase [Alphaproteobacteria bacterium]|nr:tyrosine-type recombinase/integrase [Alphaproteobacteria bacterium]